jgi:hypothetical protein
MKLSFPSVEMRSVQRADEEVLWLVHEADVADLWEIVEVPKFDKDGNPVLDKDGNAVMEKIQRPRLMSELPEDLQRVVDSVSIDGHARMVPKVFEIAGQCGIARSEDRWVTRQDGEATKVRYLGGGAGYYKQVALAKRRAGVRWLKARRGGADDGIRVMNEVDQADAEDLTSDVSDEVLETAAKNEALPAWTWVCSGIGCPG